MKAKYYYITGLLIAGLLLFSCSKEVDFTGQLPPNKLVLNCFVTPDSVVMAQVSSSWNLSQEPSNMLRGAVVDLYINGELKETMLSTDSMNWYYSHVSTVRAKEGDIVKMEVRMPGYPDIKSETLVPGKAEIISIDTLTVPDQYGGVTIRSFIKFSDLNAGSRDYYRLIVEHFFKINDSIVSSELITYDYDSDPALQEGFASATDDIMSNGVRNVYGIFSDNSFDGGEYTLNISFNKYSYWYSEEDDEKYSALYRFKLVTLSESAYLYLKSRTYHDYNGEGDPFTEPQIIYNNIDNGLGIMGAFQEDAITIEMSSSGNP